MNCHFSLVNCHFPNLSLSLRVSAGESFFGCGRAAPCSLRVFAVNAAFVEIHRDPSIYSRSICERVYTTRNPWRSTLRCDTLPGGVVTIARSHPETAASASRE